MARYDDSLGELLRRCMATESAVRTVGNLHPVPIGNGGIQVELHAGGIDLEIEIDANGKVTSVLVVPACNSQKD